MQSSHHKKHTFILTPGDPTGIGPEIAIKALQQSDRFPNTHFIVIGSLKALEHAAAHLKLPLPSGKHIHYEAIEHEKPGEVAYQALEAAVKLIAEKKADALVTGPISKKHLHEAGHNVPGHTEILEDLSNKHFQLLTAKHMAEMLFVYKKFRLLLLTRHIELKDVPVALAKQGAVSRPLKTLISFLRDILRVSEPKIAFLGVNPHAGEIGGEEEKKHIKPVIHAVNAIGNTQLAGPFPADGFFRGFDAENPGYDAIVATYHDQGLIPMKILAGHEAVNVTIGLPFIRTSVSHGTADDITGKGVASEESLIAAIKTALELTQASS